MAIITSRAVGVDTTANQPAAATANRLYVHTTSGSKLYLPEIDDGSAWQPWRANFCHDHYMTVAGQAFAPGAAFSAFGGATSPVRSKLDFTRFRQGRIIARGQLNSGIMTQVDLKFQDTTNGQALTNTVAFTSATISTQTSVWLNLNSATFGGDAEFECQGVETAIGDAVTLHRLTLELR